MAFRWKRFLARRLTRLTYGLEPEEITAMIRQVELVPVKRDALSRVATLVANGAPSAEVFSAIAEEGGRVAGASQAQIYRYATDGSLIKVVTCGDGIVERQDKQDKQDKQNKHDEHDERDEHKETEPSAATRAVAAAVLRSGHAVTVASDAPLAGEPAGSADKPRFRVVGAPISVRGQVWGLIVTVAPWPEPIADDLEPRIAAFADLAAAAVSNAQARADLAASMKRVVSAGDEARRKIERNLHDGTQQRLVTLALQLRQASDMCPEPSELRELLSRATDELVSVLDELREIAHGVHPAILSQAGLRPALRSLARRATLSAGAHILASARPWVALASAPGIPASR